MVSHRFGNEHELSVRGRYALYGNSHREDETCVIVQYGVPFGLPVSRKTRTGVLEGRIYDSENPGRILRRVMVRLNELTTATDERGNFTFGSLKPGKYYLSVDKAGIGMDRVTVGKSPIEVIVTGGKKNRIEVAVVRGAGVKGRVAVCRVLNKASEQPLEESGDWGGWYFSWTENAPGQAANGSGSNESGVGELVDSYGLANVLIELANSSETVRRFTDRKGRFFFEDVRPGTWTLKVAGGELPEHHYLEKDSLVLDLKAGDRQEIVVRILPQNRPIQIIETGGVVEQGE
jgi:hypothetical protein